VTVIDGGTGSVVGRRTAAARNVGKVAAAGASLGGQCVPLVTKAQARPGGGDQLVAGRTETAAAPTPAPPTPAPQSQAAADHADIPVYQPSRPSGKHKSDDEEGDGESDDEERLSKRRSGGKGKYDGLFGVSVAFGGAARQAVVAEVTPTVDDANYEGKVYPEVIVSAEVYPAVAFTKSFVRNFGLGVTYSHHLSISTKVGERDLGTSSQELLIDLRYRWPLFNWATPPELLIVAGGGLRDYTLDENDIMTSFNYRFLRFGLDGYVPFGTPLLGVSVGFDVRPLLTVGQEAVNFLGSKSGGLAFAVRGGVRGRLAFGLSYFAELEYLRFGTSFQGLTASGVSDAGKNKRDRAGATDGTDRFIRFWLGAGYAL